MKAYVLLPSEGTWVLFKAFFKLGDSDPFHSVALPPVVSRWPLFIQSAWESWRLGREKGRPFGGEFMSQVHKRYTSPPPPFIGQNSHMTSLSSKGGWEIELNNMCAKRGKAILLNISSLCPVRLWLLWRRELELARSNEWLDVTDLETEDTGIREQQSIHSKMLTQNHRISKSKNVLFPLTLPV